MARGNRRQAIFRDDLDRRFWLKALGEVCGRTGWRVHAWVLMGNHFHLFLETPAPNLVEGMKWLQNAYTRRFNTRHKEWGRLFGDRYKAIPVEGRAGLFYEALCDYIHLNPLRAGLVRSGAGRGLLDYPWSSLGSGFAVPERRRPAWLAAAEGLAAFDFPDTVAGRRRYVERLEKRAREEPARGCGVPPGPEDARRSHLRRGWYWGGEAFAESLLAMLRPKTKKLKNRTYGSAPQHRRQSEEEAGELLRQGLRRAGLTPAELPRLPGSDPRKAALALELWDQTTVSQSWLAERLWMKSAANVSQILRRMKNR
jgi:REP element-mobilizing transposase RayT